MSNDPQIKKNQNNLCENVVSLSFAFNFPPPPPPPSVAAFQAMK